MIVLNTTINRPIVRVSHYKLVNYTVEQPDPLICYPHTMKPYIYIYIKSIKLHQKYLNKKCFLKLKTEHQSNALIFS